MKHMKINLLRVFLSLSLSSIAKFLSVHSKCRLSRNIYIAGKKKNRFHNKVEDKLVVPVQKVSYAKDFT